MTTENNDGLTTAVEEVQTVTGGAGRGHYLDAAGAGLAGVLPGGYIDPTTRELYNRFIMREMGGREEKILASKGLQVVLMNQAISSCLVSLGPLVDRSALRQAVLDSPQADIETMLITLRRASLGDIFSFDVECPVSECKHKQVVKMDLSALEVTPMASPLDRHLVSTLTTGKIVHWHIMTANDREWMATLPKRFLENEGLDPIYLARIDAINGINLNRNGLAQKEALRTLEILTFRDRNEFREIVEEHEGGIDTTIQFSCPECKYEWEGMLPVGDRSFFFPSARKARLRAR